MRVTAVSRELAGWVQNGVGRYVEPAHVHPMPVDSAGRFQGEVEHWGGMNIFEANPKIVEFLRENGMLLHSEQYRHRYPHCWRCKNPVVFRATPQWFISMDDRASTGEQVSLRENALEQIGEVKWHPSWGQDRMRNMFKGRPDWCVSRQRFWGVPIPVFYCQACDETIADPKVVNHVADIFARETADAWYARPESELLPEGFKCPKCEGSDFRKETDILDVWFDSGSSCIAVLETRGDTLRFPADVYLEGGDQYRGWFNSSLMCGMAAHDIAPYRQVITHGWVVDGEGKKQSKSLGNVTAPQEIIDTSALSDFNILIRGSAELAYQEKQAGNTAMLVFPLSVLLAFLILAAQYNSWSLPLSVPAAFADAITTSPVARSAT